MNWFTRLIRHMTGNFPTIKPLEHLDDTGLDDITIDQLDFPTPCDAGPHGIVMFGLIQCTHPAEWDVKVHHCTEGNQEGTRPVVMCTFHLQMFAAALSKLLEHTGGYLPCGRHADDVFELVKAKPIKGQP